MPGAGSSFSLTVVFSPGRSRATVVLAGNLDIDTRQQLADAVDLLAVAGPTDVDIDVALVEYAGSVLPNFLARVRNALPSSAGLSVSRPNPAVHHLLGLTDTKQIARIDGFVPAWTTTGPL